MKGLVRRNKREHWGGTGGAATLGVVHYFREIVVVNINDRFGGRRLLPKAARYVPQGSVSCFLRDGARGQREQDSTREKPAQWQDQYQTIWWRPCQRPVGFPCESIRRV